MESAIIDPTGIYIYSNFRAAKDHYDFLRNSNILPNFFLIYKDAHIIRRNNPDMISRSIFNQTQISYLLKKVK